MNSSPITNMRRNKIVVVLIAAVAGYLVGCHLPKNEWNPFWKPPLAKGWDPTTATYTNN